MSKNQIILCVIGGLSLIVCVVLGVLLSAGFSERDEMVEALDVSKSRVEKFNTSKITPSQASVDAFDVNRDRLETWSRETLALVTAWDFAPDGGLSPEAFKSHMVEQAQKLSALPGGVNGKLVKEGFGFGFKDYIVGGSMPEAAKLAELQRAWSDVNLLVSILSQCGVVELLGVTVVEPKAVQEDQPQNNRYSRKAKAPQGPEKRKFFSRTYELKFDARAAALVRVLNALANAPRFITVDSFGFGHAEDTLMSVVGGGKEKVEQKRGRGGRRAKSKEEPKDEEEFNKKGLVTDPQLDKPLTVVLSVSTHDFGTEGKK